MSKYDPLWKYVKENNKDEYKLSLKEKWVMIVKK